ncbi:hypothetical protein PC116_g9866 [Phytophthora cactorum]|uniref:Uncharacterized protein n=1 Tax=Phytophthora cactorum TaxID=29920 RepID=A0A329S394_9STRA|nr:hypothetical protein PC114_g14649 [Phytophthora cactorum]KAG2928478.1 hypothetical protein PC117_g14310 [Phytophthora cactorum]KAG3020047.1 hypothetical protein PC119_g10108 [Phytophthora cactorum]KAG3143873.1 hypothetical protein C6341_g18935 [Phytophthora cactorum]KAG4242242.1 hypothetical protein PC116_g9866 [Phytophthora cactorum]
MIDLPLKLGSLEKTRTFIVVSRLDVDGILDTDRLKAFRAVINLDGSSLTLENTGEACPRWTPRMEESNQANQNRVGRHGGGGGVARRSP